MGILPFSHVQNAVPIDMKLHLNATLRAALIAAIVTATAQAAVTTYDVSTWQSYDTQKGAAVVGNGTAQKFDYTQKCKTDWSFIVTVNAGSITNARALTLMALSMDVGGGESGLTEGITLDNASGTTTATLTSWSNAAAGGAKALNLTNVNDLTFVMFHASGGTLTMNVYADGDFTKTIATASQIGQTFGDTVVDHVALGGMGGMTTHSHATNKVTFPADNTTGSFEITKAGYLFDAAITPYDMMRYYGPLATQVWKGVANRIWNTTDANWTDEGESCTFRDNSQVVFDDNGSGDVILEGNLVPFSVLVNNSINHDYSFTGDGKLAGGMQLTKEGCGTLTISTENEYTGGTFINGGVVVVTNAKALGSGDVNVNDGILHLCATAIVENLTVEHGEAVTQHSGGNGAVRGTLTIRKGGTFKVIGERDAFGYSTTGATKNIVMEGTEGEGNRATLALEQDSTESTTMTTNITMRGYSAITVKEGGPGFNTFGGNITVDGVENSIAVIDLRNDVTIEVAAEGELSVGKFTQYATWCTAVVTKTGEGNLTIAEASTLPGMLNINSGMVSIEADTSLAGLSLNASGALRLTTGANMHIGSIVSMGADQSVDAMISGALEVANDNMHGVGGKGLLKNTCMETSDNYTIENMSISGSLIDVGEGITLYLVNVDIKSDTHITDEAAWLDMQATNGWLDKDNTQVVREYTTGQDTTLFKSGDTGRSITLAAGTEIVELTSDMFDTVTMTGTDLWLDMTGIVEATYNKDYFTLDFKNLAHSLENAQVDVDNLRIYATLDGERYTEAYSTASGGLTTTLYFAVPEPATSTLSLLALAALAARKRRK